MVIACVTAVVVGAFIEYKVLRASVGQWLLGRPRYKRVREAPPIAVSFEIDLPCERCRAPNIGVEAGEWVDERRGISVFRTCGECGHTQWWADGDHPPKVRRREKSTGLASACPACGYSFAGLTPKKEDRESGRFALVRQCPECGRAEFFVPAAAGAVSGEPSA